MQINSTCDTSAPDTSLKRRVPWELYVETRTDVEIFYQWVLLDGLNLWWMWTSGKSSTAIISSTFSRRATFLKTEKQFRETSSASHKSRIGRPRRVGQRVLLEDGLMYVLAHPQSSTREIGEHCGLKKPHFDYLTWSRCSSLPVYTCAGINARGCSEALWFLELHHEPLTDPANVSCRHHMKGWSKLLA